jgi:hypothetical protein
VRSRTARVMTTLMRNGRDRRSENPSGPTRYLSAGDCPGPISGSHQGQRPPWLHRDRGNPPSDNRPYTWLHPNASQKSQIPLAPRAPSIHGPSRPIAARQFFGCYWGHNGHWGALEPGRFGCERPKADFPGDGMIRHSDSCLGAVRPSELRDFVEHRCSAFDDEARIA